MARGQGAHIWDVEGNEYIDCVGSWGPLILGHAHPAVVEAVCQAAQNGTSFGAATAAEVELAQAICQALPSVEMVRLVNSGTEAVMSALRLARAFTSRDKIIKFEGAYHGHADGLLAKAGSGLATLGVPDSPGVPKAYAELTITLPYGDRGAVRDILANAGHEVAAVIVEPVAGNMGVVLPTPGFLQTLRDLTLECGTLLIFDEVITGFRVSYGGAQSRYGVSPDLTCLGKIIGGGLPVGAYGGRRDIMEMLAPVGPVYQAGTLSGNPLAVAAGLATLRELAKPGIYDALEEKGRRVAAGFHEAAQAVDQPVVINQVGSLLTMFFTDMPVHDWNTASQSNPAKFVKFFWGMIEAGVYLPPSQFEALFFSLAHSDADLEQIIAAARSVLQTLPR